MRCASATLGARRPRHRVIFLDLSWLLHNHWHVSDHVPAVVVSPLRHSSRRRHHHPCDRGRTAGQFRVICSFAHIFSVLAPNRPLFVANFPFWRVEDAPRRSYAWRHYAMSYSSRRQALKNCHARPLRQVLSGWFPKNFRPAMPKFPWKIANYPPPRSLSRSYCSMHRNFCNEASTIQGKTFRFFQWEISRTEINIKISKFFIYKLLYKISDICFFTNFTRPIVTCKM